MTRRRFPGNALTRTILSAVLAAALVVAAPASAQQVGGVDAPPSPRLTRLDSAVQAGDRDAPADFWTRMERDGTPLIEEADVPGHSVVSFVYRGGPDVEDVRLDSNLNALLVDGVATDFGTLGGMNRISGTDVWHLTFRLRNDVRVPYAFEVTRPDTAAVRVLDPLNPVVWEPERSNLASSVLELPGAPPRPWRTYAESEEGDWDQWRFEEDPDSGRTVYVYKPEAWDADRHRPYPALVGLGAFGHGIGMRVDRLVEDLIRRGRIPPVVVALSSLEAGADTTRYTTTTEFVADRLLPGLRERYGVSEDPRDVVLSGSSRRGMVAALVAFRRPGAVGNVISLSGSYYWRPPGATEYEWVPHLYATHARRPVRFYVAAGELETVVTPNNEGHYLVATNRRFRDVLRAAGYALTYREFNGVHSELSWQRELAEGLTLHLGDRHP